MGHYLLLQAGILRDNPRLEQGTGPVGHALSRSHALLAVAMTGVVMAIATGNLWSV
jgi:hypothetical protein